MASFFISYRRGDSAGHTGRLNDALANRFGKDAFFRDIEGLAPGVDFTVELERALESCEAMLVVIGPGWVNAADATGPRLFQEDDFVRREVATALADPTVHVIPVLVDGAALPTADRLPPSLAALSHRQSIELSDTRWSYDVEQLGDALAAQLGLVDVEQARARDRRRTVALVGGGVAAAALIGIAAAVVFSGGGDDDPTEAGAGVTGAPPATATTLVQSASPTVGLPATTALSATDDAATNAPVTTAAPDTTVAPDTTAAPDTTLAPPGTPTLAVEVPSFEIDGLVWTTETDPPGRVDWREATAFCEQLGGGFRLPTLDELMSIAAPESPNSDGHLVLAVFDLDSNWIWSGDEDGTLQARVLDFNDLEPFTSEISFDEGIHALCVSG